MSDWITLEIFENIHNILSKIAWPHLLRHISHTFSSFSANHTSLVNGLFHNSNLYWLNPDIFIYRQMIHFSLDFYTRNKLLKVFCKSLVALYWLIYSGKKEWFSGRVLDLRSKGCWFETHRKRCIVSFSKTLYPLLSTGSTQKVRKTSQHDWKIVEWDIKHQHKQITQ